ncbi:MAG: flagellar export chaperone FlgN [Desulfurivibrionaceae bacterium]|jgi:flagellar biosynthesis/type III secretory pathway chaperone
MQHTETTEQNSLPAKFYETLEQEVLLSQDMLAILNEEQKSLVSMDMQGLIRLSAKKENRLSRLQALDSLLAEMAGKLIPEATGPAKLSSLVPLLNQEEGEKLGQYRKQLTGLREEILSRNQINSTFAEDVKTYLNDAITLITRGIADRPMYGLTGRSTKPSLNQPALLSREV